MSGEDCYKVGGEIVTNIRSDMDGHEIRYERGQWVYDDTRHSIYVERPRPCGRCGHAAVVLEIGGEPVGVDACIAPIVVALNRGGIPTAASCCGHGRRPGQIMLADGRELILAPDFKAARAMDRDWPPINEAENRAAEWHRVAARRADERDDALRDNARLRAELKEVRGE